MKAWIPLAVVVLAGIGCATPPPPPKPVYINRDVTRVVVLPPFSEVIDTDAWKIMWPHVMEAVAARGYRVVSRERVDAFYAENKFHTDPAEIGIYSPTEIAREFGADAVFYSNITRWSYQYVLIFSSYGVEADFEMVDGKTEERLWTNRGSAVRSEAIGGNNEFELVASVLMVAGNAFMRSSSPYARDCVASAIRTLPHAGYDPALSSQNTGTKEGDPKSDQKVPGTPAPEKTESLDP